MQNILELKQKLEEQAKMRYGQQRKVLNEAEEKKQLLMEQRASLEQEAFRVRLNRLNIKEIKNNEQNLEISKAQIINQDKVIAKEERELENRRRSLEMIIKERKGQEKLKERAFQRFMQEEAAAESKAIDELTSYTYGSKSRKAEA